LDPLNSRSRALLQSALVWPRPRLDGRRVADRDRQHEHVHLRDRPGLHPHGARGPAEDAGDHRLAERGRRLDPRTRRLHQQPLRLPRGAAQNVPPVQGTRTLGRWRPARHVHLRPGEPPPRPPPWSPIKANFLSIISSIKEGGALEN
jgi:hypothetical protein